MLGHDIIVIGASAGGVEALKTLVAPLPKDLSAAIFIVVHVSPQFKSLLPDLLSRCGSLSATHAKDGEAIEHGRIYVAPPDYHLLVKRGYIRVVQGPKENRCRPAVDPLFRTAAKAYKSRVVGVVLSGMLDDGTAGLIDVKKLGGMAVVQNPDDALFSGMPNSAIEHVDVDHILPVVSIAPLLVQLTYEPIATQGALNMSNEDELEMEPDIVELDGVALRNNGPLGISAGLICPDCGGSLFQLQERNFLQFRCRVGHAFSQASLQAAQAEVQEKALWAAIYSLEERAELMFKTATDARSRNRIHSAKVFEAQAIEAQQRSDLIRQALFMGQLPATATGTANNQVPNNETQQELTADKVVVLAVGDGGISALSQILVALPLNFPAAIIVVQHLDTQSNSSSMASALSGSMTLPVKLAQEGEPLRPSIIYFASPNEHLLVTANGTICLSQAVFVDFARPSADLLLESVAASFKQRAIAVILSGTGNDGALGVQAIHQMGGKVITSDDSTSEFFDMPDAAISTGTVDFVLPVNEIASRLINLVTSEATE
ncbi:chemotaxis protein CheB [Brasilonema octagenarum]|uniref:protein-glutamate methylesterase n=1 Tax=Brasilonema octagenarum UFV-OR1 TaxID=417115 RepID=A0ABX1MFW4_9CYAN|nr:chemotaxis protein CheB [Brasilonema octagenarum]NMF64767.1 chemotaxis protein CheB [Brasilonema octagenarum UFV-OR1]